ncbi:MAG: hypothetical protein AAF657_08275 [Acidobacteriota bacterium]
MRYLAIALISLCLAVPAFAEPSENIEPENAFVEFDAIANHYKCYRVVQSFSPQFPQVQLSDQFKSSVAQVITPRYLCNPTKKNNTGIVDESLHYVCFDVVQDFEPQLPRVLTSNQFGEQILHPVATELLCLPSKKEHL